jgi:hypothetical protein
MRIVSLSARARLSVRRLLQQGGQVRGTDHLGLAGEDPLDQEVVDFLVRVGGQVREDDQAVVPRSGGIILPIVPPGVSPSAKATRT